MSLIKSTHKINRILKSNPNLHFHSRLKYWIWYNALCIFKLELSIEYEVYTI